MQTTIPCPRCRTMLVTAAAATAAAATTTATTTGGELSPTTGELHCEACHGVFLSASEVRSEFLNEATTAKVGDSGTSTNPALQCPGCRQSMQELQLGDTVLDRCQACGGVWLDGGEQLERQADGSGPAALSRYLLYSLSLPERAVRSTIGLAAGAARETAEFLVPQAFQSSKTYEIVVRNSLRFLTDDIGGAKTQSDGSEQQVEDYMARKAVGNFVDLAGLATLHASPLWLLAIVSDVAYGSKTYVRELAVELQQQGLVDETSTIHNIDDVLEAVQTASGKAASTFDTPPLSVEQLKQSLKETREAVNSADYRSVLPEAELEKYWNEMREVAKRENVSLLSISGAMTMHSLGKIKTASRGALTGVQVAGGLFNRHVLGHYVDSLEQIRDRGFYQTVRENSAPYIDAVWNNFATDKESWTERIASGRVFGKACSALTGWFGTARDTVNKPEIRG